MQLDRAAVEALEILNPKGKCGGGKGCSSLFQVMNKTSTACGAHLLRANLLQPLTDIETLSSRYSKPGRASDTEMSLHTIPKVLPAKLINHPLHSQSY